MIVCFKCSTETKAQLDELVAGGHYVDVASAIAGAVANMVLLQSAMSDTGAVVFGAANPEATSLTHTIASAPARVSGDAFVVDNLPGSPSFLLRNAGAEEVEPVTIDRWIFGQFSKLLPAKASCRALARRMTDAGGPLVLEATAAAVAAQAGLLGKVLEETDNKEGRSREDALAVGFPSLGQNASKSHLRFANQFVGSFSKGGRASGLLIEYRLAEIISGTGVRIGLTKQGWDFAVLPNPAMDETTPNRARFSDSELSFLREHIRERVPHEAFALTVVLGGIEGGLNTPEDLDRECGRYLPDRSKNISSAFITTQRTGVISRASELGLIDRKRNGIRVEYVLTEAGEMFLRRLN